MVFEPKNIVGLEIASSQIRFVRMNAATHPAKVLDFGVVDLFSAHPENVAQQLMALVQQRGLENLKASLAVSDPAIVHHTITIPPMSKKDMRKVVEREVRKLLVSPSDEVSYDWKVSSETERAGVRKREVLVAMAPCSLISGRISLLEQSALKPSVLTTIPLALHSSLRLTEQREKTTAFVHLGEEEGYILLTKNGKWGFSRDFPLAAEEEESGGLPEVHRSMLYFSHNFPGEEIERVLLSGEGGDLDLLTADWSERLGVKATVFDPVPRLDLAPLGGRAEEFRKMAARMVIPLGLGHGLPKDLPINLLAAPIKGKAPRPIGKKLTMSLAAGFLLLTVGGYLGLLQRTNHYSRILRERQAAIQKFQPLLRESEEVQKQRDLYDGAMLFLQQLPGQQTLWVEVLQELSWLVPEELLIQSLKVERIAGKWQAHIKGEVTATDPAAAFGAYNRFRSGLKASPLFAHVESPPLKTDHVKESPGSTSPGSAAGRTRIGFEITCQLGVTDGSADNEATPKGNMAREIASHRPQ
ncbi:MAG: pilus assembly protein PilM [Candidatus Latescibacterota bacterium]